MSELKIGETYQIDYNCEFDPRRSYKGQAVFTGSYKDDLLFDLLDPPHEKECCFRLEDIVGHRPFTLCPDKISRVVVIGENGREFEKMFDKAEFLLQDDGRTIKIIYK